MPTSRSLRPPRHVGLGRSDSYDAFLEVMSERLGNEVYQSDYLVWIDPGNPYESLHYYIVSGNLSLR